MIRDEDIEDLKKHLDQNGKLLITDDLPPAKKERFEFINSLNIDLVEVLSRKKEDYNVEDETEDAYVSKSIEELCETECLDFEDNSSSNDSSDLEGSNSSFTENDNVSVDELNDIF